VRSSAESTSLDQRSAPWHLGASPQGYHWERARLPSAALALSWPRALTAKHPGSPVDILTVLTKSYA